MVIAFIIKDECKYNRSQHKWEWRHGHLSASLSATLLSTRGPCTSVGLERSVINLLPESGAITLFGAALLWPSSLKWELNPPASLVRSDHNWAVHTYMACLTVTDSPRPTGWCLGCRSSNHEISISLCERLESQPLPHEPSPFLLIKQCFSISAPSIKHFHSLLIEFTEAYSPVSSQGQESFRHSYTSKNISDAL